MPKPNPVNAQTRKQIVRPAVCDSLPPPQDWWQEVLVSGDMSYFSGVDFCIDGFTREAEIPVNGGFLQVDGTTPSGTDYDCKVNYAFGVDFRFIDVSLSVSGWSCPDIKDAWTWEVWAAVARFGFTAVFLSAGGFFIFTIQVGPRP